MPSAARIGIVLLSLTATSALAQTVTYEKYKLPNDMTVILHEDHTLPVAGVNIWYRVGAKDEPERRSGFAHLFEHLMFMGTERVPGADFDNIMEAGGGWNNATTSEDRTNYFEMGPAELLPTLLWLEADRLEDVGKTMTTEKLDKQRAVVRNERRQSYENAPYGKSQLRIHGLMFPKGHPYHIPVIGTHQDLEAATVDDVKNFFATYYTPCNASLVVVGDFDPAEIKPLIAKLFGTLKRGSDVEHAQAGPVKLSRVIRITETDTVQFARTTLVYHSPATFAPGDAEMDLTAAVLSSGISSRLYQKLVYQDELAVSVQAFQASMLLGSLFYIQATAKPGVSLDDIETAIDAVVANFLEHGPTTEELERQKARIEYGSVSRLQSILTKADILNRYEFYFGEPNSFERDLNRYRNATPEMVRAQANEVLTANARLILRVVPEIKTADTSARDTRPDASGTRQFAPMIPDTFKLANGITVHHWYRPELPLVAVSMLLPSGTTNDPQDEAGLASLTANMLDEGAGGRSAVAFADALDQIGADFDATVGLESTTVDVSVLSKHFDSALELYADAILRPNLDPVEWKRVHALHVQRLKQNQDEPRVVARNVAMRTFFGDAHPYSRPAGGTLETAAALTLDDVKAFHRQVYEPSQATFLVAGDLSKDRLKYQLEKRFGAWRNPAGMRRPAHPQYPKPANETFRVAIVNRPGAVQTVVRFVMPASTYADPNRIALQSLNTILGGSFTSRLNQNLREKHGYTYGARSSFTMNPSAGYLTASASVRADVTGASVSEFLKEFRKLRSGDISAGEAHKASATRRMKMIQSFQGLDGVLSTAATLVRNNRPFDEIGKELAAIAKINQTDLNKLAGNAVALNRGLLLLVGDKNQIVPQLANLDLPKPIELTVTGDREE
jgi:zinc protease